MNIDFNETDCIKTTYRILRRITHNVCNGETYEVVEGVSTVNDLTFILFMGLLAVGFIVYVYIMGKVYWK